MPTRFALIGGFLGAGKTTLISRLAAMAQNQGRRVGIITNDQAADLVDTHNLRSLGFDVGEVSGACFCCSFDKLVETADELVAHGAPDLLLGEPVGSCTDIVATVVLPLAQRLGERFEIAPFGVLVKPSHASRLLAGGEGRSGFSPQADYIFRKQLEEADYLMIGRGDQLSASQIEDLIGQLSRVAPGVPVSVCSPATGDGVAEILAQIDDSTSPGGRILDIDYDTYAIGEAEMGWVNAAVRVHAAEPVDLDALTAALVRQIASSVDGVGSIAHVKATALAGDTRSVANVTDTGDDVRWGLRCERQVDGPIDLILNARVAMAPQPLETAVRQAVDSAAAEFRLTVAEVTARSLSPGRPTPTHRVLARA